MIELSRKNLRRGWRTIVAILASVIVLPGGLRAQDGEVPDPRANVIAGDSSFETGVADWTGAEWDRGDGAHGRASLLLPEGVAQVRGPQQAQALLPGVAYTFSFYARAETASGEDLGVIADVWHLRYSIMARRVLEVGPQWQRYAVEIPAQGSPRGFFLDLQKQGKGRLWIDACQMQAGPLSEYRMMEPASLGYELPGGPGGVFFEGEEPVELVVHLFNGSADARAFELRTATEEYGGGVASRFDTALTLAAGSGASVRLAALEERRPGYYTTRIRLVGKEGVLAAASAPFGAVVPPPIEGLDEGSFFGIHGGIDLETAGRIGARWYRDYISWRWEEPTRGDIRPDRARFRRRLEAGFHTMETVKITQRPDWARGDASLLRDPGDYYRFLGELVARGRGVVDYWEIENEPYLVFPAEMKLPPEAAGRRYGELVRAAAAVVKKANPEARVMADCASPHSPAFNRAAFELCHDVVDAVPIHPYAAARYIGPNGTSVSPEANEMRRLLLDARGMIEEYGGRQELWVGELGWALDLDEDFLGPYAGIHADYVARAILLARSVAQVERIMWFTGRGGLEREHYEYGLWRDARRPLPAAAAYATLARLIDHARPVRTLFDGDVQVHLFDGPRGAVAAVWKWRGEASEMRLALAPGAVKGMDLMGRERELVARGDRLVVPISEEPFFLVGAKVGAGGLADALVGAEVDLAPVRLAAWMAERGVVSGEVRNNLPRPLHGQLYGVSSASGERVGAAIDFELQGMETRRFFLPVEMAKSGDGVWVVCAADGEETRVRLDLEFGACVRRTVDWDEVGSASWSGLRAWRAEKRAEVMPPDPTVPWHGPEDLSFAARLAWDADFLYLRVAVRDDVFSQERSGGETWRGDSLQLAIDAAGDAREGRTGYDENDHEFTLALTEQGPQVWRAHGPPGSASGESSTVRLRVGRQGEEMVYLVGVPWSELRPLEPVAGRVFGLNVIANDDDGQGRECWIGLTPGIGEMKAPHMYGKFALVRE